MNNTTKRAYALLAVIGAFFAGLAILIYSFVIHGSTWATSKANQHLYSSNGSISTFGDIYDCNGDTLAYSENGQRKYNSDPEIRKATLHAVGDLNGYISTGVQYTYRNTLAGYSPINGIASIVQYGKGNDIHLTIDSQVCRAAYTAMNGRNGAVCAYNYKTGKIVCMVSTSTYDPERKPTDIDENPIYEGVYLNRAITGVYTPGSTFKVITAVSALENIPDIESRTYNCDGEYETGDGVVICNDVHGKVTFRQALNHSCNSAFADIAIELGSEKLTATAKELGFNTKMNVDGVADPSESKLNISGVSKVDLGWAGIGQYTTLANPYHMMSIMGCIANRGQTVTPYLIDYIQTPQGVKKRTKSVINENITMSASVAEKMNTLLRSDITDYYGDSRFPGLQMCGKTGTAEIDDGTAHSWFVGYSQNESTPYAIACVVENGGSGLSAAAIVANSVMQALK